jgi:hypothetical protein
MVDGQICYLDPGAEHRLGQLLADRVSADCIAALRPVLPQLVSLMHDSGDRPIRQLARAVELIVAECFDAGETGDACTADPQQLHRVIRRLLAALEALRGEMRRTGHWADSACPPIMFG